MSKLYALHMVNSCGATHVDAITVVHATNARAVFTK